MPAIPELADLDIPKRRLPPLQFLPQERDVLQAPENERRLVREGGAVLPDRAQPVARTHEVAGQRGARGPCCGRRLRALCPPSARSCARRRSGATSRYTPRASQRCPSVPRISMRNVPPTATSAIAHGYAIGTRGAGRSSSSQDHDGAVEGDSLWRLTPRPSVLSYAIPIGLYGQVQLVRVARDCGTEQTGAGRPS